MDSAAPVLEENGLGYVAPATVEEAAMACADGNATILAGGTDLMVQFNSGLAVPRGTLVNLRRVGELRTVSRERDTVRIGALTTVTDVLGDKMLARAAPVLAETADRFASMQIRNMATVGGNICNASPAGDMIVPLLLLDADVELASWDGKGLVRRRLPLRDFFTGPGATRKAANEILTAILFDAPPPGFAARFYKTGPRPALEISVVSVGVAGAIKDGVLEDPRIALGAVAPTPVRCPEPERAVAGKTINDDVIAAALDAAEAAIAPISDVRGSDWYRRHLVRGFLEQGLKDVTAN